MTLLLHFYFQSIAQHVFIPSERTHCTDAQWDSGLYPDSPHPHAGRAQWLPHRPPPNLAHH